MFVQAQTAIVAGANFPHHTEAVAHEAIHGENGGSSDRRSRKSELCVYASVVGDRADSAGRNISEMKYDV